MKLELKCDVSSGEYGFILSENVELLMSLLQKYVDFLNAIDVDVLDYSEILNAISVIWFTLRNAIYKDCKKADEGDIILCLNGNIIIDGESEYFELN
jgi:hypothetical protein